MVLNVELPQVGESVTEAVIGKWLKSPGDHVEKYDPLVEVITDKVNMDVPAPASGTLTKIIAVEGATVPMGSVIAEMETPGSAGTAQTPGVAGGQGAVESEPSSQTGTAASPPANRIGTLVQGANVGPTGGEFVDTSLGAPVSSTPAASASGDTAKSSTGRKRFSPVVTRLAAQHGVDLNTLTGTGLGGRVTRNDVLAAVEAGNLNNDSTTERSPQAGQLSGEDRVIEPTPVRRMIADHMVRAMNEIPHAWSAIEVDVTGMVDWRAANRQRFEQEHGVGLTYLPITLHTVAAALKQNPRINSSWHDGQIILKGAINVGVAVAAEDGLVVPVVHTAASLSLPDLAKKLGAVIDRARSGSMTLEDVRGGTFTLNNTGALGSVWGGAIINHPQAAILTTEAIVKRPVVITRDDTDAVVVRSMMNICLSFDHRIIDGAEASAFLQTVKNGLEAIDLNTDFE
ncbi:MAG: dihydrolipoamide acetyltransferase family protein [Dehalococcoidia bacterium]|jgi:2-oxoisovalerate dehydrogenase E2 component (dihydrolipoyl transacylase)|nr:dihydrolipoamide acetyltransferase family protein [Dehalococcoidia bacterium]